MINNDNLQVLTVKDLMEVLHLGKDRAYALMRSRSFPALRIGKSYLVTRDSLEKWLDQNAGRDIVI